MKNYFTSHISFYCFLGNFLFFWIIFSQNTNAQTKLTGKLKIENASEPSQTANIIINLMRAKDSTMVKTTFSEENGKFEFEGIKEGDYLLYVSNPGYKDYLSQKINVPAGQSLVEIPVFALVENETKMEAITITAQKAFIEKKIDRIVVNPDALVTNAGLNGLEILERSPMVRVDENGIISLRGRQGVVVFIDDKPTYLSTKDLAGFLAGLPSGSIESIEIMTNPPAKYDAAGSAGVINIKLKRLTTKGYNGNVQISGSRSNYWRGNTNINLNYRVNKINFFTSIGLGLHNSHQDLTINRNYLDNQNQLNSKFTQRSFIRRGNRSANLKLGMDYYINKKSTLGVMLTGNSIFITSKTDNDAILTNAVQAPLNYVNAVTPNNALWNNISVNLNYNYKIDTLGKEISANLDYLSYDNNADQSLTNSIFDGNRTFQNRTILASKFPATIDIKTAKVDYVNPLKNGAKIEIGLKSSLVNTKNNADFSDVINGENVYNGQFSNKFQYDENINAGYLNYSQNIGKFAIQAGLRAENTNIKGYQYGNPTQKDSTFNRNYTNLFPTLFLQYTADSAQHHQFGFSYGRRISRPDYQSMNPFIYPLDAYTLYAGNPFLQPTFTQNFELSHTYKGQITTTLTYTYQNDDIGETIERSNNVFYSRPNNYGVSYYYGVTVNANFDVNKWWSVQLYTELINVNTNARLYGQNIDLSQTHWFIGPTNQFKINKQWTAELGGRYTTSALAGQFVVIPVGNIFVGVAKKVFKNKGTVKVNVSDLFYTQQPGGDMRGLQNATANWHSYLDSRVFTLSLSWRFEQGKHLRIRQNSGADSERQRIKM